MPALVVVGAQWGDEGKGKIVHFLGKGADWVVRVSQLQRKILVPSGKKRRLSRYLRDLPLAGTYELELRARPKQPARTALLEVRYGALSVPPPAHQSPYVKKQNPGPLRMWVVWVREIGAPKGVPAVASPVGINGEFIRNGETGFLATSPEDWHKALKTGCRVTDRQLKTKERLEAMLGLMSVVAVRLLQLKSDLP